MQAALSYKPTVQFAGLDVLRCCAALAIVFYHATLGYTALPKAALLLLHNLPVGVDFFFIISGFLITYLLLVEKSQRGAISLPRFYLRRSLRIFPLYFGIVALAWWLHAEARPDISFRSYCYFGGNFWMIARNDWTVATLNPLWSLCIEEQFYLIIPLLLLLLPIKRLPWLFGGIIAFSIGFRAYATITMPYNWMTIYCHTLSRCDLLALGGGLAWWHFTQPIRLRLPRWTLLVALAFLVLLLSVIDCSDYTSLNFATFKKYLYVLPLVFIFCFTLFNQAPVAENLAEDATAAAATTTPNPGLAGLNYLGKISYGLYMYHSPIIFLLDTHPAVYDGKPLLRMLLIVGLTIATAALSYEAFEKQILRLKGRFEVVRTARA